MSRIDERCLRGGNLSRTKGPYILVLPGGIPCCRIEVGAVVAQGDVLWVPIWAVSQECQEEIVRSSRRDPAYAPCRDESYFVRVARGTSPRARKRTSSA